MIYLIQLRRNFLTSKFMVFIFSFKMLTNSGKLSSEVSFSTLRTTFLSVLFKKLQESFTVYSISLTHPIIFSKIRLNNRIILLFRSLVISNKTFIAINLIRH